MTVVGARKRALDVECAEALEADAQTSGERCDDLVEASAYWHAAGEHEREERALRTAAEVDDDHNVLSGRAALATFLLTHGRREEGERALARLLHEGSECEWAYGEAAAGHERTGRPREALRWLNVGVSRFVPDLDDVLEVGDPGYDLLAERARLRRRTGLPPDAYDELHARSAERAHAVYAQIEEIRRRRDAVLYWPEEEFAEVQRRFPGWHPGVAHAEHRREVQRALVGGAQVVVAELDALLAFAAFRELPPEARRTRDEFAADAARRGRVVPGPPGRNERCWCGADRKYKRCCGAPGIT
ncbi:SEC-C metal-binding domain-containing protein [Saccharopolyspora hordei]|uniref:Phosphoglycolate phosphatase-like HAD superfamily hydrolase n=1 Tax=Saccharopolyspora hordei TaxID=1838 RepID=A0A853ANJ7_9PSEU|nr:phosphoglycolate phosphatase-like HAD superfamily hydrolase [Saccharopolyspora hordei]